MTYSVNDEGTNGPVAQPTAGPLTVPNVRHARTNQGLRLAFLRCELSNSDARVAAPDFDNLRLAAQCEGKWAPRSRYRAWKSPHIG
jgi:hypothetical protein